MKVDIEHPAWEAMLEARGGGGLRAAVSSGAAGKTATVSKKEKVQKKTSGKTSGKKAAADTGGSVDTVPRDLMSGDKFDLLIARSKIALLEEQILKNDGVRYLNEQKKIKLKREAGELIDFKLAEFLYLGYMEKTNIELLGLCKKIEPMIDNLVKKGDTKGVIDLFNRNFENILTEVKKAQADDLEAWQEERE